MTSIGFMDLLRVHSLRADWPIESGPPVLLQRCSHCLPVTRAPCGLPAVRWFDVEGQPKGRCDVHSPSADFDKAPPELSYAEALVLEIHGS
jgi:hypothetical protein